MNDVVFRTNIRMISALSFVPIADTINAFDVLSNHCGNQEQVILDYFETTYIGELRRGRRLPPRFPHAMWNMNLRVQQDLPRTIDLRDHFKRDMRTFGNSLKVSEQTRF